MEGVMPLFACLSFLPLPPSILARQNAKTKRKQQENKPKQAKTTQFYKNERLRNEKQNHQTTQINTLYYIYIVIFFFFVIKNETAVTFSTAFRFIVVIICVDNIIKLILKICLL